jgi:hypothetical protein
MKISTIGNKLHSIDRKGLAKPLALLICAVFVISMVTAFATIGVKANTTPALHVSGNQILDSNNNVVYLRGVGIAGMAPDLIFWGPGGSDNWGDLGQSASSSSVTDTLQVLSQTYHVNMIRVFFYPEWYYLNTTTNGINIQSYITTLVSEATQYGIYVDLVPYQLTACSNSFSSDPYLTPNQGGAQGLPMCGWDSAGQSFLASTGLTEQQFWAQLWTMIANNLKDYSNAIFEAWNEPNTGGGWGEPVPSGYQTYLQTMYSSIRGTGATNLIFLQWEMGWCPGDIISPYISLFSMTC